MKKLCETVCWVFRYIKITCIGNQMRKQFFLEKLLERSNRLWFAFPQEVFKEMCKDLSFRIQGDYMSVNDLFIEGFHLYQNKAHLRSKKCETMKLIPVDALSIKEIVACEYRVQLPVDALSIKEIVACEYRVQLLKKVIDYTPKMSEFEGYETVLTYTAKVSFREIENRLWSEWILKYYMCRFIKSTHFFVLFKILIIRNTIEYCFSYG